MKKIISLFARNYDGDHLVRNEVVAGAEWVTQGLGVGTRKFDGTCCMVRHGELFKRHEMRGAFHPGTGALLRCPPPGFEEAERDALTRNVFGWLPVGDGPDDKWHREAFAKGYCITGPGQLDEGDGWRLIDGTYELCGPKVQGNPERLPTHFLVAHGMEALDCPRDFDGIKAYLAAHDIEGVVWHHQDGRLVKIKGKDFGLRRWAKP